MDHRCECAHWFPAMEDLSHDKDKYQRANDKQTECDALMLLHI